MKHIIVLIIFRECDERFPLVGAATWTTFTAWVVTSSPDTDGEAVRGASSLCNNTRID